LATNKLQKKKRAGQKEKEDRRDHRSWISIFSKGNWQPEKSRCKLKKRRGRVVECLGERDSKKEKISCQSNQGKHLLKKSTLTEKRKKKAGKHP